MNPRLSFGGLIASEWIKLWSVRATWWCFSISVAVTVLLSLLVSSLTGSLVDDSGSPIDSGFEANSLLVQCVTVGLAFARLVVVVIGALVITGEFGTGMIRSTFMAAPGRISAVLAKALVFGLTTFVLGLVSLAVSMLIAVPLLSIHGFQADLSEPALWWAVIGGAGFLALSGVFATAIGSLLRNSAGAIATALGIVLVLPIIVTLMATLLNLQWLQDASQFLPSTAGGRMYALDSATPSPLADGSFQLDPWGGALVLAAWVVVIGAVGLVTVKRRDV